jgi:hypothetical protein
MVPNSSPLNLQLDCNHLPSPNKWFAERYPAETKQYGHAFLQSMEEQQGWRMIRLPAINHQFFAAILGGRKDLGHKTVYLPEKHTFYFKDHDGLFKPTTEQKLQTYLACLMMKCAESMPSTVDRHQLTVEYRSPENLKTITKHARSILQVDADFFESGNNRRKEGRESMLAVTRHFVSTTIHPENNAVVTIDDVYAAYLLFCEEKGFKGASRNAFKKLIGDSVRDEHGIGIRNDLRVAGCWRRGWKGITLKHGRMETANN